MSSETEYQMLADLPASHPLRCRPLVGIGAEVQHRGKGPWHRITANWRIANNTYNELGSVWKTWSEWRVPMVAPK